MHKAKSKISCYLSLSLSLRSGFLLCSLRLFRLLTSVWAHLILSGRRYERQNHIPRYATIQLLGYGRLSQSKRNINTEAGFPPSPKGLGFHPEN